MSGFAQLGRLLSVAAAMAILCFLAMAGRSEAQGQCPQGYRWTPQGCVVATCGAYQVWRDNQCVCVQGYTRKGNACVPAGFTQAPSCGAYQVRVGNKCACMQGYVPRGGACVPAAAAQAPTCGAYEVLRGRQCVCVQGYTRQSDGKCRIAQAACKGPYEVSRNGRCDCQPGYVRSDGVCRQRVVCNAQKYEVERNGRCECQPGYVRSDGVCRRQIACRDPNAEPYQGACRCKPGYQPGQGGRCQQRVVCNTQNYEVERNGRCECQPPYKRDDHGKCVIRTVVCTDPYEVRRGDRCVCAEGYDRRGGRCVRPGGVVVVPPVILPPPLPPPGPPPGPAFVPPPPPPAPPAPPAPPQQALGTDFVPGQLLVGFRSAANTQGAIQELAQAQRSGGVSVRGARSASIQVDRIGPTSIRIRLDFRRGGARLSGREELEALQEYARRLTRSSEAAFAHPNWIMELGRTLRLEQLSASARVESRASLPADTSDPALKTGLLWHYQAPPVGMNALAAWSLNKGSRDVVVAVIDTGILPDHPDIKGSGNVLAGYNFITDPEDKGGGPEGPDPDSTDRSDRCSELLGSAWHGTHVAGTVGAASSNNDIGIVGVNWTVSVLPIRAMGRCGRGTLADLAAAVSWAAGLPVPGVPPNPRKADVINLSLSIGQACNLQNVGLLKQALDDARKAGAIVVAAAGNKKSDIKDVTPAGCRGVISVAASDARGHLAPYSNFGNVTLMAPGGDLDRDDDSDNRPDGIWSLVAPSPEYPSGVAAMEGTSMAAPHVAAAIALALSAKPELRGKPDEIERLLKRSLARLPPGACRKACGAGLLDAKAMVQPEAVTSSTKR